MNWEGYEKMRSLQILR